jgi:N-acetylglucosaminyl-diphospho-decaprenol L-rhamnosyltransferase
MKLLGIILNYKTPDMTLEAARGLARALELVPDSRFVIVDNDSQDGSFEKLRAAVAEEPWRDKCEVLASGRNGGFGAGNNFAMRRNLESKDPAEYFYLLNSDAIPAPDAAKVLVDFMDGHGDAAIAGSYVHGPDGSFHNTAFRYPSFAAELEEQAQTGPISKLLAEFIVALPETDRITRVDWTAAVSMVLRARAVKKFGLFDETFFLYFEETDLCRRAVLAGYAVYYVPQSKVSHIGSVSTGMKNHEKPMPKYWFEAREHYFRKHHGDAYYVAANVSWLAGRLVRGLRRAVTMKKDPRRPHITRDFVKHNFAVERFKK